MQRGSRCNVDQGLFFFYQRCNLYIKHVSMLPTTFIVPMHQLVGPMGCFRLIVVILHLQGFAEDCQFTEDKIPLCLHCCTTSAYLSQSTRGFQIFFKIKSGTHQLLAWGVSLKRPKRIFDFDKGFEHFYL